MKDAVETLAQTYLEVRNAGCMQFDDMYIIVKPHADVCIEVKFALIKRTLHGRKSENNVLTHLADLSDILKDFVENWEKSLAERRL